MDRPLDPDIQRRARLRRQAAAAAVIGLLAAGYAWGPSLVRPTVSRARLRLATVQRGPIEASISASGTVRPAAEQVVASPLDARVLRIHRRAGDAVAAGDPLLELDLSASRLEVERLAHRVALEENARRQAELEVKRTLADLAARREIRALQAAQLQAAHERQKALAAQGLVADEVLQQAELAARQAAIEVRQLDAETASEQQRAGVRLDGLALQRSTARGELDEARRRLQLAALQADRSAVVTWAVTEPGAMVRQGDPLARLADLGSFRVEATAADVHARVLAPGQRARVQAGDAWLEGRVTAVEPAIRDGVVTFQVALDDPRSTLLRSQQRVDVLVVTGRREQALCVDRGPGLNGTGAQDVFVIEGGQAVKRRVRVGLVGFDKVELLDGVQAGEQVVVSDMADWQHVRRLGVR